MKNSSAFFVLILFNGLIKLAISNSLSSMGSSMGSMSFGSGSFVDSYSYDSEFLAFYDSYAWLYNDTYDPNAKDYKQTLAQILDNQECDMGIGNELEMNANKYRALPGKPTKVNVQVIITNVGGLSDTLQEITLSMFIDFTWTDPRLKLTFSQAGDRCTNENNTYVMGNMMNIWFPFFTIDNSVEKVLNWEAWEKFPGILYPNGTVFWRSSFRFVLSCDMNFETFPYDHQNCELILRSPNYKLDDVVYKFDPETVISFWDNRANNDPLWEITGKTVSRTRGVPGIKVYLRYLRKSSFYTWTLVLPTLVISILTGLTFLLPPDDSEKMTTITTGVLAYFLLLLSLTGITPTVSENMPALAIFFLSAIGVATMAAIATALILRLASRTHGSGQGKYAVTKQSKQISVAAFCGCSLSLLNNICLFLYILATLACYIIFFVFINTRLKETSDNTGINYTDIHTINA